MAKVPSITDLLNRLQASFSGRQAQIGAEKASLARLKEKEAVKQAQIMEADAQMQAAREAAGLPSIPSAEAEAQAKILQALQAKAYERMRMRQTVREPAIRWSTNPDAHLQIGQKIRRSTDMSGVIKGFDVDPMANMPIQD